MAHAAYTNFIRRFMNYHKYQFESPWILHKIIWISWRVMSFNTMKIINMVMSKYPMNMYRNMNIELGNMKRQSMIWSNSVKVYWSLNFLTLILNPWIEKRRRSSWILKSEKSMNPRISYLENVEPMNCASEKKNTTNPWMLLGTGDSKNVKSSYS